jgi:hypothetical protein
MQRRLASLAEQFARDRLSAVLEKAQVRHRDDLVDAIEAFAKSVVVSEFAHQAHRQRELDGHDFNAARFEVRPHDLDHVA